MKTLRLLAAFCAAALAPLIIRAQQADLPLNHEAYILLDRLDIRGFIPQGVYTDVKPMNRRWASESLAAADTNLLTRKEKVWLNYTRRMVDDDYAAQFEGKGILKYFYRNGRDIYSYRGKDLEFYLNPILYLSAGGDQHDFDTSGTQQILNYRNSRGAQLRGSLFGKVGFFTEVIENQAKYPQFIFNRYQQYGQLWNEADIKIFEGNGFDYMASRGYVTWSPVKQLRIKVGKDRMTFGNGIQSLQFSDYAPDHLFLDLNTRVWKIEYVNHFAQFIDWIPNKPDPWGAYPRKYGAFHQLYFHPTSKVSLGLFEGVIYSPTMPGQNRGFELEYMNPIIFYRSVEAALGSPDNATMGASWKANFQRHFQTYGQLMLDDFNWRNRVNGKGYWGNKYGYQLGLKYIDVAGVRGLDFQAEYNRVRPFTYSHFNPTASYTHFGQFLGHSSGANLQEIMLQLRWQATPRINATGMLTWMEQGGDSLDYNFGSNPLIPYSYGRHGDYNNFVGQGVALQTVNAWGKISYRILNLDAYAEVEARVRRENEHTSLSAMGTFRMNIPYKPIKY